METALNLMDWIKFMAIWRIIWRISAIEWIGCTTWPRHGLGWLNGTRMQLVGFGQDTWPLEGLYGSPMQLDGLEGLHGHDKVYMDYMPHECNWIGFIRIHVHLQDYISHPCNWIDWKDCVVMTRFKCIDCNTNEYDGLNKLHGHLKDYMAHTCN